MLSNAHAEVEKEYVAKVNGRPTQKQLDAMRAGCDMDGVTVVPVYVDVASLDPGSQDRLRIVVRDGRNREVRRLVEHAGACRQCQDDFVA
jgi:pseudouridine synthase